VELAQVGAKKALLLQCCGRMRIVILLFLTFLLVPNLGFSEDSDKDNETVTASAPADESENNDDGDGEKSDPAEAVPEELIEVSESSEPETPTPPETVVVETPPATETVVVETPPPPEAAEVSEPQEAPVPNTEEPTGEEGTAESGEKPKVNVVDIFGDDSGEKKSAEGVHFIRRANLPDNGVRVLACTADFDEEGAQTSTCDDVIIELDANEKKALLLYLEGLKFQDRGTMKGVCAAVAGGLGGFGGAFWNIYKGSLTKKTMSLMVKQSMVGLAAPKYFIRPPT